MEKSHIDPSKEDVDNFGNAKMNRTVSAQSFFQGKNRVEQISDYLLTGVVLKSG
jgi:hypothetical protein